MIDKYTSTYEIIEKIYRDGDYQDELPWEDCIAWMAEALDDIGAYPQYLRRVTGDKSNPCLDIVDYRAKLPCDFYQIEQVAVDGKAATYAGNTFHHLTEGACCTVPVFPPQYEDLFKDNFGNDFTNLGAVNNGKQQNPTYDVNDNFLTLNCQTGKVCIAYLAKPIDKNGFPLVPDLNEYRKALASYCIWKLDYREWRRGKIDKDIYKESKQEWLFNCGQAKAAAMLPSLDKMEHIKKMWLKLIPEISAHKTFFK